MGAEWSPLGGAGASAVWRGGLRVERSTCEPQGALGVEGARWPLSPTAMASALSEEASDR